MEINDKIRISFVCARNDEWFKYEFFFYQWCIMIVIHVKKDVNGLIPYKWCIYRTYRWIACIMHSLRPCLSFSFHVLDWVGAMDEGYLWRFLVWLFKIICRLFFWKTLCIELLLLKAQFNGNFYSLSIVI